MGVSVDDVTSMPPLFASAPRGRSVLLLFCAPRTFSVLLPPSLAVSLCPQLRWFPYLPIFATTRDGNCGRSYSVARRILIPPARSCWR